MSQPVITRILMLSGHDEASLLAEILHGQNPGLDVVALHDRQSVVSACARAGPGTRLVAFCSSVIVPGAALAALPGPSYNFHPGPPTRPGRYPSVFALYDSESRFGITVHEMHPKVDSGPIVAVDTFVLPPHCDLRALEHLTFQRLIAQFRTLARHLATDPAPLPVLPQTWSGRKTTLADATALSRITGTMSEMEIARRKRACGGQVTGVDDDPGWSV